MTDALIIFDRDLNYVDVNVEAAKQMGAAREQIIGRNIVEFSPTAMTSGRAETYQKVLRSGVPRRFEFVIPHAARSCEIVVDASVFPIREKLVGVRYYDISGRVTAQKALEESEEALRSFMESATDIFAILEYPNPAGRTSRHQ